MVQKGLRMVCQYKNMKKKPLKLIALTLGLLLAANAQATIYEHRQYFTGDMTANQACDAAEREVRRLALSAQLGEIIQSSSFQQCLAQGDEAAPKPQNPKGEFRRSSIS